MPLCAACNRNTNIRYTTQCKHQAYFFCQRCGTNCINCSKPVCRICRNCLLCENKKLKNKVFQLDTKLFGID